MQAAMGVFRARWMAAIASAAAAPFLLTAIPPLTDVPGHIGRFAVQAAPAGSPVRDYFGFHWQFSFNLGADLLVEALRHVTGLFVAVWIVSAAIPAITALGLLAVARALNPRGAHGLPWALIFVFNYPFLWGFLNYSLAAGLALLAFALWVRLDGRERLRGALFLAIGPLLFVVHGVGGALLPLMIGGHEAGRRWPVTRRTPGELARALWPLAGAAAAILALALFGTPGTGQTLWVPLGKLNGLLMAVRDQNRLLDMGTVIAACGVFALGLFRGARLRGGAAGAALALALLYLAAPRMLAGTDHIDTRLPAFVAMVALALQDWSGAAPAWRRRVLWAGIALLAVRMAVTTVSFADYGRSYARELAALDHVAPGARVLNLTQIDCPATGWRAHRLEHLSNLATPLRGAWVNSHWALEGVQLLEVRYRPPGFWRDPSQLIWPAPCIDASLPYAARTRHGLAETLARLPLESADYLWLIGVDAPVADPRLEKRWSAGSSVLYAVRAPVSNAATSP